MIITDHAARRYIRRLAPSLTLDAARALLARVSAHARLLPQRTDAGQQLWQTTGAEGAVLVVKHDRASGPVVVTVLSAGQTGELSDEDQDRAEVIAAFERAASARSARSTVAEEDWRARYDRLNKESDAAEERHSERVERRPEHWKRCRVAVSRKEEKRSASIAKRIAERAAIDRATGRDHDAEHYSRWAGVLP